MQHICQGNKCAGWGHCSKLGQEPKLGVQGQKATIQGDLFPSTPSIVQAVPACSDHATSTQNRGSDYWNVLSVQVHLQNIQPEASTACCSLTDCTQGAVWTSLPPSLWLLLNSQVEFKVMVLTYIAIPALRPFKLIKPSLSPCQMLMLSLREPVPTWCVRHLFLLSFHARYQFSSFSTATLSSSGSIHRYTPYLACDF